MRRHSAAPAAWLIGINAEHVGRVLHSSCRNAATDQERSMPRIFDRRSQRTIGVLDIAEFAMFQELMRQPELDSEIPQLDASAIERLESIGASDNLRLIVRQVADSGADLDLGWELS